MTNTHIPHVIVVDDDPDLRELLSTYLQSNGMTVSTAEDAASMHAALATQQPDVMVLDLMLPGEDGLSITRHVKASHTFPVLMLSARGEELDRIIGLEVGVDDYMAKPFNPRELLARLRALLRRPVVHNATSTPSSQNTQAFGPYTLDLASRTLKRDGHDIDLTTAEFELLEVFVTRPNRVLSRDTMVDLLKGFDRNPFDRSIDNRVTRLRKKIEPDSTSPRYIRTVRGEGYLFNPNGEKA